MGHPDDGYRKKIAGSPRIISSLWSLGELAVLIVAKPSCSLAAWFSWSTWSSPRNRVQIPLFQVQTRSRVRILRIRCKECKLPTQNLSRLPSLPVPVLPILPQRLEFLEPTGTIVVHLVRFTLDIFQLSSLQGLSLLVEVLEPERAVTVHLMGFALEICRLPPLQSFVLVVEFFEPAISVAVHAGAGLRRSGLGLGLL